MNPCRLEISARLSGISHGGGELRNAPRFDCPAQATHDFLKVMQVVDGVELCAEHLVHALKVVQVGAREMRACVTAAALVHWLQIATIAAVAQFDDAVTRIEPAI